MGDLDISLIKEFSSRPGFYDRNDVHFKDKTFATKAWNEISNQLGYEVHMLKDRIYQLRNRYNLEKRRLENLRHECPTASVDSPWPLFSHLSFLDSHIRPRRSYKTMMRRNGYDDNVYFDQSNSAEHEHPSSSSNIMISNTRRTQIQANSNSKVLYPRHQSSAQISIATNSDNILIKDENDSDNNNEEQATLATGGGHFLDPSNYLADSNNEEVTESPLNSLRNGDANTNCNINFQESQNASNRREILSVTDSNSSNDPSRLKVRNIESLKYRDDSHFLPPSKRHRRIARSEKYDAFGKFLAHSFCDLDEDKALKLVEKFTAEVVKALIENHNVNNSSNSNIN